MKNKSLLKTVIDNTPNKSNGASIVFNDQLLHFVYRKSERIISAIYLVTEHIDDKEPIKFKIRERAVGTVDRLLSYKGLLVHKDNKDLKEFISHQLAIMSFMETAVVSGLIKETNYFILIREIESLLEIIHQKMNLNNLEPTNLRDDLLRDNFNTIQENKNIIFFGSKENRKGDYSLKDNVSKGQSIKDNNYLKQTTADQGQGNQKVIKDKNNNMSSIDKTDRENKILNLFKLNVGYNLKDIAIALPDFSEKTTQRELNALVKKGVLYKEGSRRWTKYFLVSR